MVGKVIKLEYVDSYTGQNGELFNFAVLIENDKTPYFVSVKDKDKPGIAVGDDLDFTVVEYDKSEDKKQHKRASIGGKQVDLIKIKKNQPKPSFGGGGGNKNYVKTPEQYKNELLGYIGGYAKDVIAHRVNLGKDAEEIITVYEKLVDGMFKALSKHIQ